MKKYRVNVNGTAYEVQIELIDTNAVASAPAAAPTATPDREPKKDMSLPLYGKID